jgi:hypothetical protein
VGCLFYRETDRDYRRRSPRLFRLTRRRARSPCGGTRPAWTCCTSAGSVRLASWSGSSDSRSVNCYAAGGFLLARSEYSCSLRGQTLLLQDSPLKNAGRRRRIDTALAQGPREAGEEHGYDGSGPVSSPCKRVGVPCVGCLPDSIYQIFLRGLAAPGPQASGFLTSVTLYTEHHRT